MNEEQARGPRLTTATAISVARSLTTCTGRNDALATEVSRHLAGPRLDGSVVSEIFVRFPMWLGYYLESDLQSAKFWAGAQMWILPGATEERRPDCYYEKTLPAMARVPFQWRAVLASDGQVSIFTDRSMVGKMEALQYGSAIAEALEQAHALYLAKHPGAAAGLAA